MQILFVGYDSSDARLEEAREAGHAVDHHAGLLDAPAQGQLWKGLMLAPPDVVWVRWSAVSPLDVASLRRFRVARPTVRLVIDIPETLQPPDTTLGELVAMGIYDIVGPMQSLRDSLRKTPTYADAARWQWGGVTESDAVTPTDKRRPVIEKKIASTRRPALITVRGLLPGAGTTLLAIAVARWLAEHGYPTALLEYFAPDQHKPSDLARMMADDRHQWPSVLHVFPSGPTFGPRQPAALLVTVMAARQAAYIVLDLGAGVSADVPMLVDLELSVCPPPTRWAQVPALAQSDTLLPLSRAEPVIWMPGTPNEAVKARCRHVLPLPDSNFPALSPALDMALGRLLAPIRPDVVVPWWKLWWHKHHDRIRPWALSVGGLGVLGLLVYAVAIHWSHGPWPHWHFTRWIQMGRHTV
ncbi:hypothetical protein BXT84_00460 [Sulfobacillus thermotolerans]|uniref:Uncharacterized protein n=1 Tax=Sulfobacillus thermotolerans TaxID=338644 RepID=A0ABM6RMU7_9FIRM|nr:hypothetical protein BXT84_00460 [Sulfobacillus thermotolerans]